MKFTNLYIFIILFLTTYFTPSYAAREASITFSVKALFKNQAVIDINGNQHLLSAGEQSPEGVKLISSNAKEARILCHGKEHTLYINQSIYSGSSYKQKKSDFKTPKKLVPGKTIAFTKSIKNGITRYILKGNFDRPTEIKNNSDSIWIGSGKKLLRFDIFKDAWSQFDSSYALKNNITKFAVSDNNVILNSSTWINNKKEFGLFTFDYKNRKIYQQLNIQPGHYQFIDKKLWFISYQNGLGFIKPGNRKNNRNYTDFLINKDLKQEHARMFSVHKTDIWYTHHSKIKPFKTSSRLNETCVTHYNIKSKKYTRYTRKDINLKPEDNCSFIAASSDQVWVSHDNKNSGLSMYNISTNQWQHFNSSSNNIFIGGQKILLNNQQLWMLTNNQLISLNTETLHANIVLGDAAIQRSWQSAFHITDNFAWFSTIENAYNRRKKSNLVLYKIPVISH